MPQSNTIARASSRRLLEVVRGAVRDASEHDLLGGAAREEDLHHVDQLVLRVQVAILGRQVERVAERRPARDDRHLLHRQRIAHRGATSAHGRPRGRRGSASPSRSRHAAAGARRRHAPSRRRSRSGGCTGAPGGRRRSRPRWRCWRGRRRSGPTSGARSSARSTSAASGLPRVWTSRIASRPAEIGRSDEHLPVEAAGPQQRRVEVLETVRRAHHDDLVGGREAVELDEELVERLVLLAVEAVARAAPHRPRRARR